MGVSMPWPWASQPWTSHVSFLASVLSSVNWVSDAWVKVLMAGKPS